MFLSAEQLQKLKDLKVEIVDFQYGLWNDKKSVCYVCTYKINNNISNVKALTKSQLIDILIQKESKFKKESI
jgi:hypothetical protein